MGYNDERGRAPTRMAGIVGQGLLRQVVAVRNLSVTGAMVELVSPPIKGEALRFECTATGAVDARVAWVVGNRCGLLFDRPIVPQLSEAVA